MAAAAWAFYNYGRKNFNRRGWLKSPRLEVERDLNGRVYAVTGANSGLGKVLAQHLYKHGARVYMVCRSEGRAQAARDEIVQAVENGTEDNLRVVLADMSLKADVERAVEEIGSKEKRLDALVCNAGALPKTKTMTKDGVETTFACHFLMGTYWLGTKAMPLLEDGGRIVVVTSGGMYTTGLLPFKELIAGGPGSFDGQNAYARAKRAQVALTERWGKELSDTIAVSAHPGWTLTPGVTSTYGWFSRWFLSPLRSPWEGAEGIAWLCVTDADNLKPGALYLDGQEQVTHLHKSTETPQEEVDAFMADLDSWAAQQNGASSTAADAATAS